MSAWFAWPGALPLLLLVPAVWLALTALDRARAQRLGGLLGPRVHALAPDPSRRRRHVRRALFCGGLLFAGVALLQPAWGEGRDVEQRGVDLLVCLDVSRSMLARDVSPDRLGVAREQIAALAERARGDRLGLVVFAGDARLIVPLTRDVNSFTDLVADVGPLSVERGGTDLGAALATALEALGDGSGEHEAVLLLTDGEDLGGRGLRVAETCARRGIAVHCVGLGSARGSRVTIEVDGKETFLRDRAGNEVLSRMDPASLGRIAETTGGAFVAAHEESEPLLTLYDDEVVPMARKAFDEERRRERENRFQWPLLAAFGFLLTELGLGERGRR